MNFKRLSQVIEILLVFIGVPVLYYFNLIPFHKAIPLAVVFLVYLIIILLNTSFNRKRLGLNGFKGWKLIWMKSFLVGIVLLVVVLVFFPNNLFNIPRNMPFIWLAILVFYPIWSVLPQEFIYRVYFYHRFKHLIKELWILHLINALLFSFSHIIFRNWLVLLFVFIASFIFSYTYSKTKSFMAVFIEHAIYGNLVFTIGLGDFFYLPLEN